MPNGPAVSFSDPRKERHESQVTNAVSASANAPSTTDGDGNEGVGTGAEERVVQGEKEGRSRSVVLSLGCRRCLSCELLYDLVSRTRVQIWCSVQVAPRYLRYSICVFVARWWCLSCVLARLLRSLKFESNVT